MIGVPMPNPRDSIIDNLNQQLDAYFGAGKSVQVIPNGVGVDGPYNGTSLTTNASAKNATSWHRPCAPKQTKASRPTRPRRT